MKDQKDTGDTFAEVPASKKPEMPELRGESVKLLDLSENINKNNSIMNICLITQ